jgi:aminomethyltransferase
MQTTTKQGLRMLQTPLHSFHVRAGARMVDFAGWEMPVTYEGLIAEHNHTRLHGSLFDVSHMGRIEFRGPDAEVLLERLNTRNIGTMQVGQSRYSHMCREDGGILDDVIVSRLEDHLLVVCNASNREKLTAWWAQQCAGLDVTTNDKTADTAMIALQGPEIMPTITELLPFPVGDLKRYHFKSGSMFGASYFVARSGYTGEDGVEIILPAAFAETAVTMLISRAQAAGRPIKPAGLGARDSLRTEAGMPLYGHELSEAWDPVTAGQKWVIGKDKDYIGKAAIDQVIADGPAKTLVGLEIDSKRTPRQGAPIAHNGAVVGEITSGITSPTLGKVIAMGFVPTSMSDPRMAFEVDLKTSKLPALVVPLPFYKRARD